MTGLLSLPLGDCWPLVVIVIKEAPVNPTVAEEENSPTRGCKTQRYMVSLSNRKKTQAPYLLGLHYINLVGGRSLLACS